MILIDADAMYSHNDTSPTIEKLKEAARRLSERSFLS